MTVQQLVNRDSELEVQIAELQQSKSLRPFQRIDETFGMFSEDPDFDEIVRLGREYRKQANEE
jgi:hypothetical protein